MDKKEIEITVDIKEITNKMIKTSQPNGVFLTAETRDKIIYYINNSLEKIERLNKLISQREKKWEKWTTEKSILSTKMSDYLCKYQNIKREYTKQIKISTDRKREIERLNNIINEIYTKALDTSITSLDLRDYIINNLEILDKGEIK